MMKQTNHLLTLGLLVVGLNLGCSSVHRLTHVERSQTDSTAHFTVTKTIVEQADTTVTPPPDSLQAEIPYTDTAVHYVQDKGITLAVQFKPRSSPASWGTPADHLGGSPMLDVDVKAVSDPAPVTVTIQKTTTETATQNTEVKTNKREKVTDKTRTGFSTLVKWGIGIVLFLVLLAVIGWMVYKKIVPVKI